MKELTCNYTDDNHASTATKYNVVAHAPVKLLLLFKLRFAGIGTGPMSGLACCFVGVEPLELFRLGLVGLTHFNGVELGENDCFSGSRSTVLLSADK